MKERQPSYDIRRNLAGHRFNYKERLKTEGEPEGDCKLCADVTCRLNITAKKVLAALERDGIEGDNVKQFSCNDREEDTTITHSLRHID